MKKSTVVLFLLAVMILAVSAAASAQTVLPTPIDPDKDPYAYASKNDYYLIIENRLNLIRQAIAGNDMVKASEILAELRQIVYRCATYLARINEYDWRILNVSQYANEAFEEGADYSADLEKSRKLAYDILIGGIPPPATPYTPGGYVPGAEGAGEGEGAEDEGGSTSGSGKHS